MNGMFICLRAAGVAGLLAAGLWLSGAAFGANGPPCPKGHVPAPAPPPPEVPKPPPPPPKIYSPPPPPPQVPASQPAGEDLAKIHRLKSPQAFPIPTPAAYGGPAGPSQVVFAPGEVQTNKKGQAVKGKLNQDESLLTSTPNEVVSVVFQAGEYVYFDWLGYVKEGTLKDDTDLRIRLDEKKVRFQGGNPVAFDRNGYVKWGVLGANSPLSVWVKGKGETDMVFKAGTKVTFGRNGFVEAGTLGEDRRLPCVNRDGESQPARDFRAGDFVELDKNGNVVMP